MLMPDDRKNEEIAILAQLRRGERVDHFQTVRVRKDGRHIDVSVTISPVRNREGEIIGASKIARDITDQKHYERELKKAKETADAANKAKDRFLAVLSHELRTPLTPVLATVTFLERAELPPEIAESIATIRRNVEMEARLIDDLLDVSRIAQSKIELRLELVNVHDVLRSVLEICRPEIDSKGVELSVALRARDQLVSADLGRLQQALVNVLQNAAKFTSENGRILVQTRNDQGKMYVEISDNGIGIDALTLPRIFETFEQGEQTTTRKYGGLGLGLSITKSLVEMHKGRITAASQGTGKGTTITIVLDSVASPPKPSVPAETKSVTGNRILLVEDHPDTLQVLSRLLKSLGYRVQAAGSVREALQLARQEKFELLISDIGLPDGSGNEIARELRAGQGIHAIALSGFGHDDDIRQSREAGFEQHLTKPINFQILRDTIRAVLAN